MLAGLTGVVAAADGTAHAGFDRLPRGPIPGCGKDGHRRGVPRTGPESRARTRRSSPHSRRSNDPKYVVVAVLEESGFGGVAAVPLVRQRPRPARTGDGDHWKASAAQQPATRSVDDVDVADHHAPGNGRRGRRRCAVGADQTTTNPPSSTTAAPSTTWHRRPPCRPRPPPSPALRRRPRPAPEPPPRPTADHDDGAPAHHGGARRLPVDPRRALGTDHRANPPKPAEPASVQSPGCCPSVLYRHPARRRRCGPTHRRSRSHHAAPQCRLEPGGGRHRPDWGGRGDDLLRRPRAAGER